MRTKLVFPSFFPVFSHDMIFIRVVTDVFSFEFEGKIRFCKNKEERKYLSCLYTCLSVSFLYFTNLITKNNE